MTGQLLQRCVSAGMSSIRAGQALTRNPAWPAVLLSNRLSHTHIARSTSTDANDVTPNPTPDTPDWKQKNKDFFASEGMVDEIKAETAASGYQQVAWIAGQFALFGLFIVPPDLEGLATLVGTLSLAAGLGFFFYSNYSLGPNLTPMPKPRPTHALVTDGAYAYMRHPMYGGVILTCLGIAAISHDESRLMVALALLVYLDQKAAVEEKYLEERYPGEYPQYKQRVKKLIPWVY